MRGRCIDSKRARRRRPPIGIEEQHPEERDRDPGHDVRAEDRAAHEAVEASRSIEQRARGARPSVIESVTTRTLKPSVRPRMRRELAVLRERA